METAYVEVTATVRDRWGQTETVPVGTLPAWSVEESASWAPWRKVQRAQVLADRTTDPRGWRVTFATGEPFTD